MYHSPSYPISHKKGSLKGCRCQVLDPTDVEAKVPHGMLAIPRICSCYGCLLVALCKSFAVLGGTGHHANFNVKDSVGLCIQGGHRFTFLEPDLSLHLFEAKNTWS